AVLPGGAGRRVGVQLLRRLPDGGGTAGPVRPETLRHRARHDAGDLDVVRHGPVVGPHGQLAALSALAAVSDGARFLRIRARSADSSFGETMRRPSTIAA